MQFPGTPALNIALNIADVELIAIDAGSIVGPTNIDP